MRSLGENPTEQELEEIIREIGMDGHTYTLFDGFTDNMRGYFASCVVVSNE